MRHQEREIQEMSSQQARDIDAEIQLQQENYEKKLKELAEDNLRMKGENGVIRKKFSALEKEIDTAKIEALQLVSEQKKLNEIVASLERDIAHYKKEIQNRDDFIQDKEKKVYELKKNNQELEKFKFVLDFKIRDLRGQIEPKEHDISEMNQHIQVLSKDLESYFVRNNNLEKGIQEYHQRVEEVRQILSKQRLEARGVDALINNFKSDLEKVMDHFQSTPQNIKVTDFFVVFDNLVESFCRNK